MATSFEGSLTNLTYVSGPTISAVTGKAIQLVDTCGVVQTWIALTFIDIYEWGKYQMGLQRM